MSDNLERSLGRIEGKLDLLLTGFAAHTVEDDRRFEEIGGQFKSVALALAERRGERKTIAAAATLAGGIGSLVISLLLKLWGHQ